MPCPQPLKKHVAHAHTCNGWLVQPRTEQATGSLCEGASARGRARGERQSKRSWESEGWCDAAHDAPSALLRDQRAEEGREDTLLPSLRGALPRLGASSTLEIEHTGTITVFFFFFESAGGGVNA